MKVVHIQLSSLPPIKAVSAYALEDGLTNDLVSITYSNTKEEALELISTTLIKVAILEKKELF